MAKQRSFEVEMTATVKIVTKIEAHDKNTALAQVAVQDVDEMALGEIEIAGTRRYKVRVVETAGKS